MSPRMPRPSGAPRIHTQPPGSYYELIIAGASLRWRCRDRAPRGASASLPSTGVPRAITATPGPRYAGKAVAQSGATFVGKKYVPISHVAIFVKCVKKFPRSPIST